MSKNITFPLVIIVIVIAVAVAVVIYLFNQPSSPTPPTQNSNQTLETIQSQLDNQFQLKIGQKAFVDSEKLQITFIKVSEDSRCPSEVQCKWEGQATVVINIMKDSRNLGDYSLTSRAGHDDLAVKLIDIYSIRLVRLDPYPKSEPVESSEYVATFIVSRATNTPTSYEVKLKSRTFTPIEGAEQFFTDIQSIKQEDLLSGKYHAVVQFNAIPTEEQKSEVASLGITLHDYLPNNAYTASVDPSVTAESIATIGLIRSLFTLERNDKLSSEIVSNQIGSWARKESGKVDVVVRYYPDVPADKAQVVLERLGAQVLEISAYFERLTVRVDESKLLSLGDLVWVSWIEPISPPPVSY